MDLRERRRAVAGKAESLAEGTPVRSAEDVGVFNEHDGLALSGNARAEYRAQVINLGQIRRHHSIDGAAIGIRECELRPGLVHLIHGMGSKIVQRETMPATTGASAAGIRGSLMLPICFSPLASRL